MRKDVQDKISMLIEKYKDNNIVRELKMSDKEIFDNISNILMYININNACEKSNSNECVNQEHLHVEIFRNKNGDIQCNYFQCPKHLKQLEIQKQRDYYGINDSLESYELSFSSKLIDINIEKNSRKILIKKLIDQIHKDKYNGIYLYGLTGVGKSYIMSAFFNQLASKKFTVNYINVNQSMIYIKNNLLSDSLQEYIDTLKHYDFLLIDNIGQETFKNFYHIQVLTLILEYRYKNKKPTYFISQYSIEELKNKYLNNIINSKGDASKKDVFKLIDLITCLSFDIIELKGKSQRREY